MPSPILKEPSAVWSGARLRRLNQQISAILIQMETQPGIQSAFVCDNHGELLGARGSAALERTAFDRMGCQVAQIFAAFEVCGKGCREIEFCYKRWIVLARDLGNAFLVIVGAPDIDWGLLRIAINVAAPPFQKDNELQISLRQAASSRIEMLEEKFLDAAAWRLVQTMKPPGSFPQVPASIMPR
jgi:hypothetical protein